MSSVRVNIMESGIVAQGSNSGLSAAFTKYFSEIKTVKKAMGNNGTIFPKKSSQFTDNEETESVESYDLVLSERIWY